MRLVRYFDHGGSNHQLCARRQVRRTEIEIDVQLIAGQLPPFFHLRHQRCDARGDHVQLHVGMRRAIRRPVAAPLTPIVADRPFGDVELAFVNHLACAHRGTTDDHFEHAVVARRTPDHGQADLQLTGGQVRDGVVHSVDPCASDW